MKKVLSVLAVVVFFAAMTAPVFATDSAKAVVENVMDEKPKKADAKKSGDCTTKAEKKSGDCETTQKKGCCDSQKEKSCGDKDKK